MRGGYEIDFTLAKTYENKMTILENIIVGVVSGVFTAAFLYLLSLLIKNHFIPWFQQVTYKGVDVNGSWSSKVEVAGIHGNMEMNIFQHGHNLEGDLTIVQGKDIENPSNVTNLTLKGNIWEGFVTLNHQSKDRSRLSCSTSLLQVLNGGIRLKGVYCFRSIQTDKIESVEIKWERKESKQS